MRFLRTVRGSGGWLCDADIALHHATGSTVRILRDDDTAALHRLASGDPVANCYPQALLETGRQAGPLRDPHRGLFLGIDDPHTPGQLHSACWVGSNVVPLNADEESGQLFGRALIPLRRRYGSIFGPSDAVRGLWSVLNDGPQQARSIRQSQPLMVMSEPSAIAPAPGVRIGRETDFDKVFPAAVNMFTEELGYSPLLEGRTSYMRRVMQLLRAGHCVVKYRDKDTLEFKADFGVVTSEVIQIQGVWIPPDYRGQGRAAGLMAAVVEVGLRRVPTMSLYVNDYNTPALRTYDKVGFQQVGEFATVLLR